MEGKVMKGTYVAASILTLALIGAVSAQGLVASAQDGDHVSKAQLKQLAREAQSPEQYEALAHYYDIQQNDYLRQAKDARHEWISRLQFTTSLFAKYPRPADSARNLYESYVEKASKAGALSARYSQLAEPSSAAAQQRM
jgi:hypothetical protein